MNCEFCGSQTRINWGDGSTVLCETCYGAGATSNVSDSKEENHGPGSECLRPAGAVLVPLPTTTAILRQAWSLYRRHFGVISAVVVTIWLPLELLDSYMNYFVFEPDDLQKSFKFSRFLDNFFGIIATAAVISIGHSSLLGQHPNYGGAMSVGGSSWGRMWLTRFLTGFCVIFGLLLLIIPGIYLAIRLALAEPVAVCERVSGSTAMTRSLQLTKGRFWNMLLLVLAFVAVIVAALACVILPVVFVPALDHWLVDAITALVCDIIAAFGILCMLCAYVAFSTDQNLAEPSTAPNDAPATSVDNPGVTEGPPSVS